ncbi:response regulator [Aquamicrobium sp. LC103]|nr:response regulator [Aquamicrobium sp. LC103]
MLDGLRILILEDEFLIAMDVEQLCRDHGAGEVVILKSLDEAGSDPDRFRVFDVAVIDVMLSGASTFDFAKGLRGLGVPFVFATGYSDFEHLSREFPTVRVVGKPYSGSLLVEALLHAVKQAAGDPMAG